MVDEVDGHEEDEGGKEEVRVRRMVDMRMELDVKG